MYNVEWKCFVFMASSNDVMDVVSPHILEYIMDYKCTCGGPNHDTPKPSQWQFLPGMERYTAPLDNDWPNSPNRGSDDMY